MATSVKIDFLVPGFSKCGTTTLCALLDRHPGIYIPAVKEPWYFSSEDFDQQHHHYDNHFGSAKPTQLKGEGSVSYSGAEYEDISIARIYSNNPDCRFIFIARDPKNRIESSYREMHNSGVQYGLNAPFSLGDCLDVFPQMISDSLYWQRISRYRERFGDDSLLVVFLEELQKSPSQVLKNCFEHLGLNPQSTPKITTKKLNNGQGKLFDTRLLRYLRNHPLTGFKLARFSPQTQDRYLAPLGLRRPFGKQPIQWDNRALEILNHTIYPDAEKFLAYCEKPRSLWGPHRKISS